MLKYVNLCIKMFIYLEEQCKLLGKVMQHDLIQAFHENGVLEIDHIPTPINNNNKSNYNRSNENFMD